MALSCGVGSLQQLLDLVVKAGGGLVSGWWVQQDFVVHHHTAFSVGQQKHWHGLWASLSHPIPCQGFLTHPIPLAPHPIPSHPNPFWVFLVPSPPHSRQAQDLGATVAGDVAVDPVHLGTERHVSPVGLGWMVPWAGPGGPSMTGGRSQRWPHRPAELSHEAAIGGRRVVPHVRGEVPVGDACHHHHGEAQLFVKGGGMPVRWGRPMGCPSRGQGGGDGVGAPSLPYLPLC